MSSYVVKKTPGDTTWFRHDRFGMFIHFGLYAVGARHEWCKSHELISEEHYDLYFDMFNPDLLDVKEWAKSAREAGMRYAVLTTKHHDGFCLFDSQYTDYKITNTQYGRDLVQEFVDAFRAEGLKVGFYYSLLDWHHPEYRLDALHPRAHDANGQALDEGRDMAKYNQYVRDQVRELLTGYGKIDIMWFDFCIHPEKMFMHHPTPDWVWNGGVKGAAEWESEKLITMIRELSPDIIINNRTDIDQDIWTPEQVTPKRWVHHRVTDELVPWESCQTFSGTWGYARDEISWKSPKELIDLLVNNVAFGGNVIMNVGPTARGNFDYRAEDALKVYGQWMHFNSRSIYGCTMAEPEFTAPNGTKITQSEDGKRLYIHLQEYPVPTYPLRYFFMNNLRGRIRYAQFLHDASEIKFSDCPMGEESIKFDLPYIQPNVISPVIEIFLK